MTIFSLPHPTSQRSLRSKLGHATGRALLLSAALAVGALSLAMPARAQVLEPFPELLDEALGRPAPAAAGGQAGPVADGPSRAELNAREIAQRFPAAQQAAMQNTLVQSLGIYQKLEAKFGWPKNDMAGATAAFLVGNYMVMTGTQVPDEQFVAVAQQLRASPRLRAAMAKQTPQAMRDAYEQQAMVGTFMALALMSHAQKPIPEDRMVNLRDTARANLRLALKMEPDGMSIGPGGMTLGGR